MDYDRFLQEKTLHVEPSGFRVQRDELNPALFYFQRDIVIWALARGKAAIFADCGLGKTIMQLEWARHVAERTGKPVLILAPLAVSSQTAREGATFNIPVTICEWQAGGTLGINITNYERLHRFGPEHFGGVVLDESSILKAYAGKVRTQIIESFRHTHYKLACTATPAPNDYEELGNHAEFLGVMNRAEMLSTFFVHDGGDTSKWRLKGHAASGAFWQWICEWAVMLRKPSDLGYSNEGFALPPLEIHEHVVDSDFVPEGRLFAVDARTLAERRQARKDSLSGRVELVAELANASSDPWLIWCDLNAESEALARAIPDAVEIQGSHKPDFKERAMLDFSAGKIRVLVTKPSIAGYGMNWQHCSNVAFVGLSDSYEQFYQAVRRVWRFGQGRPVHCHIVTSSLEGAVVANIKRKEADAVRMAENMVEHMQVLNQSALRGTARQSEAYQPERAMTLPYWLAA